MKRRKVGFIKSIRWEAVCYMLEKPFICLCIISMVSAVVLFGYTQVKEFISNEKIRQEIKIKQIKEEERAKILEYIIEQESKEHEKSIIQKEEEDLKKYNKRFPKGTRIKVYDLNKLVNYADGTSRYSIGAIDMVESVDKYGMVLGMSGEYWSIDNVAKVQSNREWSDLVRMDLQHQLKFVEE